MRNRGNLNNFFNRDRKMLYIFLSILLISVFTLTVVYAALSTTLNINGNAEVTAASWDIHLDNVQLNSNSVTSNVPTITDARTAMFSTTLSNPGDYYMFTIDVVNNGSIDAMIDSVTKTPELTDTQKKYLNYIVEYQNGEPINTKQLVAKNSYVRLKVKVEFRKDLTASDLPSQTETLNLSFRVNYVQSDDSNEHVTIDNNGKLIKVVSGDYDTVGSEICIGKECFYVISSDEDSVTMLSKMNITKDAIPKQSSTASEVIFSLTIYWHSSELNDEYGTVYPTYVYDSNSFIYSYVENYKTYLESQGVEIEEARLIKVEELENLGCSRVNGDCLSAPSWVYTTPYWSGTADSNSYLWAVGSIGTLYNHFCTTDYDNGMRPVIVVSKFNF